MSQRPQAPTVYWQAIFAQIGRPSTTRGCRICVTVRLPVRQRRETMYWPTILHREFKHKLAFLVSERKSARRATLKCSVSTAPSSIPKAHYFLNCALPGQLRLLTPQTKGGTGGRVKMEPFVLLAFFSPFYSNSLPSLRPIPVASCGLAVFP